MAVSGIKNFKRIDDELATGGQPSESQLNDIASAEYEIVINLGLKDPKYCLPDEAASVAALGMQYHHVPVVFDDPQLEDFRRFVELMQKHRGRKTFVHCALNWRVTTFVGLYGELYLDWPPEKAATLIASFWEPNPVWTSFAARCRRLVKG